MGGKTGADVAAKEDGGAVQPNLRSCINLYCSTCWVDLLYGKVMVLFADAGKNTKAKEGSDGWGGM